MACATSNLSSYITVLLLFGNVGFLTPTSCHIHGDGNATMFVFGDSFFDPGNNNYLNVSLSEKANFWPYGETFFKPASGRFSDGRLIPDFIALHANLPMWAPFLQPGGLEFNINGANFASGGSGALRETNPGTLSLEMQLNAFTLIVSSLKETVGDAEAEKILAQAVYLYSTGNNDIGQFLTFHPYNATQLQKQMFTDTVIGNLTEVLKEVYEIGGSKFAFQTVTPIACLPIVRQDYNLSGNECAEMPHVMTTLFNTALYEMAEDLETQLPGFKYSIFDFYNQVMDRINYPSKYGFKVVNDACCGSGVYHGVNCGLGIYELCNNTSEYLFFDGSHQTEHAYSQLAELWWNGTSTTTAPYTLKQLFELDSAIEISFNDFGALSDE
ncbi:Lipase_GDSL domain-containing protein [Cephalotus follicularis]|uniref:Lipase_GDSL domain-containing protein n=1 Tax=Cephalotus follicularis TaxID=3775 RepID=A0A1Q3DHR2_CEPFO|nr:Lipase_GDSL domain-containing protein [Cephalotus follicularis]